MLQRLRTLHYLVQRIGRNLLPAPIALLGRKIFRLSPGAETTLPQQIAGYYQEQLEQTGRSLAGQRILLFGFGGHFGVACRLLEAGARPVFLFDKFAELSQRLNARLLPEYESYLQRVGAEIRPNPEKISLLRLGPGAELMDFPETDVVFSLSVLEHVDDVAGWTERLAACTAPGGLHLHFVDLRDHFFDTPFEMLCYSDEVWSRWLDPRSHLNRYRLGDYARIFRRYFQAVEIEIMERDRSAFERARPRIRQEFLTGDVETDSATSIRIHARSPFRQ